MEIKLFTGQGIHDILDKSKLALELEIDHLGTEKIRIADRNEIVDELVDKYILNVPVLSSKDNWDQDVKDHFENSNTWADHEIIVKIPFDGDPDIFSIQPSTYFTSTFKGTILEHRLELHFIRSKLDAAAIRSELDSQLDYIHEMLNRLEKDCEAWNDELRNYIETKLNLRMERYVAQIKFENIF